VEYAAWEFNASQVPAEWHIWLHYTKDEDPISSPPPPVLYGRKHIENLTGSSRAYHPHKVYGTRATQHSKEWIEGWEPPVKELSDLK